MSQAPESALSNPITENDIANYLANTPDFFVRHAELLAAVQLTSPHGQRAVSLQERQAEMLRDKIKLLEHRMMEMIRNGNDNVLLSDKILQLAAQLLRQSDGAAAVHALPTHLETLFAVPQAGLRIWDFPAALAGLSVTQSVSDDAKVFASSLTEPFCGLNTGFEAVSWMAEPQAIASLALIPLREKAGLPAFGMLVLASSDAQRFTAGMGTEFLVSIGNLAAAAVERLR